MNIDETPERRINDIERYQISSYRFRGVTGVGGEVYTTAEFCFFFLNLHAAGHNSYEMTSKGCDKNFNHPTQFF